MGSIRVWLFSNRQLSDPVRCKEATCQQIQMKWIDAAFKLTSYTSSLCNSLGNDHTSSFISFATSTLMRKCVTLPLAYSGKQVSVSANLTTDKITAFTVLCRLHKYLNKSTNLSKYNLNLSQLRLLLGGTSSSTDKPDSVCFSWCLRTLHF